MILEGHIIVNQRGSMRMTKNKPALEADEIAVRIELDIPNGYFQRPYPVVALKLPEPAQVSKDIIIDITAGVVADALHIHEASLRDGLAELIDQEG